MHYLMLVTLTMIAGETSRDARQRVYKLLLEDDSFCGDGGRFGSPLCDWFVIGGRWSGLLQETLLGDAYRTAFDQEFPDMATGWFPSSLVDERRDALNQLWQRFGGSGANPVTRSSYGELGCDDDAILVDQALYDHFLATDSRKSCETFADLDDDPVDETFIGRKWLVVVDYHN
jgi:hypothetical protein